MAQDKIENFDELLDDLDFWMEVRKYFINARSKGVKQFNSF